MEQALSVHANEILKDLATHPESATIGLQLAIRRAFQALTETDQEGRSIRRPQRFGDLFKYVRPGDASEDVAKKVSRVVVARFARHDCSFLRVIPPLDGNDDPTVDADNAIAIVDGSIIDIGHEALIRRWDKLKGEGTENWIREEQEDAEQYRGLLRYADSGSTIPSKDLFGSKIGGLNVTPIVFGRCGTPGIMQTISKRFARFVRGAGTRQTPPSKNTAVCSSIAGYNCESRPRSEALPWCRGQSGNGAYQ